MSIKIVCGPTAHLKTVRQLTTAYNRAIRAEESADTYEEACKLAVHSERALKALRFAQNAETAPVRMTKRNLGKLGLATLGAIGRVIGKAIKAQLALVKANTVNVAKRAARKVRASLRSAVMTVGRLAVLAVVAMLALPACGDNTRIDERLSVYAYETELVTVNAMDCLVPIKRAELGTKTDLIFPFTAFPTYEAEGNSTWVHPAQMFSDELGEASYSISELQANDPTGDLGTAEMETKASFVPCTATRTSTAGF